MRDSKSVNEWRGAEYHGKFVIKNVIADYLKVIEQCLF